MGSATREALAAAKAELTALGAQADLATAEGLFSAGRIIGESAQLRAAIADPAAPAADKSSLVERVFGSGVSPAVLRLLTVISAERWSRQRDLLAAIEELGIRAIAASTPAKTGVEGELFSFGVTVASDNQLELALRSKLASPASKAVLVEKLLGGKASKQTLAIVRQLVLQPRGRSLREGLQQAAALVADQAGLAIATITSAAPVSSTQLKRLTDGLSRQYGREIQVNVVVDPAVLGGLRVQIGDDVIDGSIAARINEVRLQLAG